MTREFLDLPKEDLDYVLAKTSSAWEAMRGQRLLLTGGTGFIGKWLLGTFLYANRMLALNASVLVLSRNVAAFQSLYPILIETSDVEWMQDDVQRFELCAGREFKYVIHAATDVVASQAPSEIFDTCVRGTKQVLKQMRKSGARNMLLLSSGAVYGRPPVTLDRIPEEWTGAPDCLSPSSAYGEGKRASELLCAIAAAEHDFNIPVARCFAFVGPHLPLDKHFAIGNFINAAMQGQTLHIEGDGTPMRSYLYSAELTEWLWSILFKGQSSRAYNVGGEEGISILQLANRVVKVLGSNSEVIVHKPAQSGMVGSKYIPDVKRINTELNLIQNLSLDEAIRRTAGWNLRRANK